MNSMTHTSKPQGGLWDYVTSLDYIVKLPLNLFSIDFARNFIRTNFPNITKLLPRGLIPRIIVFDVALEIPLGPVRWLSQWLKVTKLDDLFDPQNSPVEGKNHLLKVVLNVVIIWNELLLYLVQDASAQFHLPPFWSCLPSSSWSCLTQTCTGTLHCPELIHSASAVLSTCISVMTTSTLSLMDVTLRPVLILWDENFQSFLSQWPFYSSKVQFQIPWSWVKSLNALCSHPPREASENKQKMWEAALLRVQENSNY